MDALDPTHLPPSLEGETYHQAGRQFVPAITAAYTWLPIATVAVLVIHWVTAGLPLTLRLTGVEAVMALGVALLLTVLMVVGWIGPRGPLRRLFRTPASYIIDATGVTLASGPREVRLRWDQIGGYEDFVTSDDGGLGAIVDHEGHELVRVPDYVIGPNGKRQESDVVLGQALAQRQPARFAPSLHVRDTAGAPVHVTSRDAD